MSVPSLAPIDGQLALSGLATAVALGQLWAAASARPRRRQLWTALCAAATAVLIGANALVLQFHTSPAVAQLLFARYAAASVLPLLAVLLVAALAGRTPARTVVAFCVAAAAVRLVLWPTTDLVYAHHQSAGWPVYGPLPPFLTLPLVVVSFGYVMRTLLRIGSNLEVATLFLGMGTTVAITVADLFVSARPALSEEVNGWVTIPLFASLLVIVGRRQAIASRRLASQVARETALAGLAHWGMTAGEPELLAEADLLLRGYGDEPTFVEAVRGITRSAAQRDVAERAMVRRATHDELTGLINRPELRSRLDGVLRATSDHVTVLQLGVDAMRSINDSFGHRVGDQILRAISVRLAEAVPAATLLARVDGDEFVVVLAGIGEAPAATAERMVEVLRPALELDSFSGSITVSVGVASRSSSSRRTDADELLHDADIAMQRAKAGGGRGVSFFDDWMRAELLRTRGLERRLARALERDDMTLHYEPIVSLDDRRPIAYEALARWRCDGEMIPPASWIPVAESTGHLIDIGRHLAELATTQLRGWQNAGCSANVSLNVSARQLRTPDLARTLDAAVADGMDPQRLWLEITEGIAVDDNALNALRSLRDKGFRIALDDFGTGYSSLHAISRLPIDIVKIDRSFIAALGKGSAHAMVAAVVSVAEANGLDIVAEGIETEYQARLLSGLGCRWGQGYLFGRAAAPGGFDPAGMPAWPKMSSQARGRAR